MTSFLAAVVLFSSNQDQDLSQKITYKTVAVPATTVVSDLASKTGVKLAAIPSMANRILVIDVKDMMLKDLMDHVENVCSAQWKTESDGTIRLGRNAALENKEVRAEAALRLENVNKALKKVADSLKPDANKDAGGMVSGFLPFGGSAEMKKICALLDPVVLANIEDGGRVVFSNSPNRMQVALRGPIAPLVDTMLKQRNDRVKAAREAREKAEQDGKPKNEQQEAMEKQMQDVARMFGYGDALDPVTEPWTKALVVATRGGGFMGMFGGGINIALHVYNAQGRVIHTSQFSLQVEDEQMQFASMNPQIKPKSTEPGTPIKFSEATKELSSFFSLTDWGDALERKPTPELEAKILQPDKYDPLSFATSEALIFCAEHKKKNLVANIPDSIVSFASLFGTEGGATVESYLDSLKSGDEVKLEEIGETYRVSPMRAPESRSMRVDRVALKKFIDAAKQRFVPSLSDYAAYAAACAPPNRTPIVFPYMLLYVPNAIQQGFGGQLDWNMLRLYGLLGNAQRQVLENRGAISFGSLSQNQLEIVRQMAFGANSRLEPTRERRARDEDLGFFELIAQMMPGQVKDFRQEPTEAMPNGLPQNGAMTLSIVNDGFVMADDAGKTNRRFGALGTDELAMFRYISEDKNFSQLAGGQIPKLDRLRLGERKWLEFTFRCTPATMFVQKLHDDNIDANASSISLEQLPDAFRQKVDKRLEAFKKMPFPMLGMGRQQINPP